MTSVPTYSHDQRFFVKTQRRHEVHVLLAHLPRYVEHLQQYPHSLLARLLGTRRRGGGGGGGGGGGQVLNCRVTGEGGSWGGAQRDHVGIGESGPVSGWAGTSSRLCLWCWRHRGAGDAQLRRDSGGGTWRDRLRYSVGLEKDAKPGSGIVQLEIPSRLSGVYSLRVAQGKKVSVADRGGSAVGAAGG
jgi:hypothetical protein